VICADDSAVAGEPHHSKIRNVVLTNPSRAHWACAGLSEHDDMTQEPWLCPDCFPTLDDPDATPPPIPEIQQERCIRPDCILRYALVLVLLAC
jgi:hypothetical protein